MSVTKEDTFDCVVRMIREGYKNPVALDFASGTNPGGGWRSKQQGTQEESLCRRSDLGILLEKKKYPIPMDSYHYLKTVTINTPQEIETKGQKNTANLPQCAIIASELRSIGNRTEDYLIKRVTDLYECAVKNKHDVIVLGAWGCGAFKEAEDDSEILAKICKKVAKKYDPLIKTVYAVLYTKNYLTFKKIIDSE